MNTKVFLVKFFSFVLIHFSTYWQNTQVIAHMSFFLKNLVKNFKDKTLPFEKVRKSYILNFKHIGLAINKNICPKILGQCICTSQPKEPIVEFVKK